MNMRPHTAALTQHDIAIDHRQGTDLDGRMQSGPRVNHGGGMNRHAPIVPDTFSPRHFQKPAQGGARLNSRDGRAGSPLPAARSLAPDGVQRSARPTANE